ncbi:MAG: BT_3044 domain-containing protein [Mucilaginibacter sp.]
MKKKFLQYTILGCTLMFLFSACRKDSFKGTETKQSGKTFVYIEQAQENDLHFLPFTDTKTVTVFTVRRDAASSTDLQKAVTVTLTAQDLDAYNKANGTDYIPIPGDLAVQTADPSITTSATGVTMNFAAGVFAKNYSLNIDGSKFDPSKHYAVLLKITNFGGFSAQHAADGTSQDIILVTLGVKNIYDGDYHAVGSITFPTGDVRTWDKTKTLATIDAATSETEAADLGGAGYIMRLKVNADNTVTVTSAPSAANPTIQNNGDCTYDPGTHTFTLNYKYVGGTGDRVIHDVLTLQ